MNANRERPGGRRSPAGDLPPPPPPSALEVALATLVDAPPAGDDWLHEIKLDGYRIVARLDRGEVQLITRGGKDWTERAPAVARSIAALPVKNAVLDGELVSLLKSGISSFQSLQNALSEGRSDSLVYYAFDLLFVDGRDTRPLPLLERKEALAMLLAATSEATNVRLSDHVVGKGKTFFDKACRMGVEGTIAKRADAPYRSGRSKDWLKIKRIARQEFVVGGFTPPSGARQHLGALLVGVREDGGLRYVGKVGTGFTARSLEELHARLTRIEQPRSPFAVTPKGAAVRGARWVAPELVAEIAFTEFTDDGMLRHPSFQGLREDKPASVVVRERPAPQEPARTRPRQRGRGRTPQ